MISKETIDTIFETARVEEVIGDFVTLKRAGQNLKGLSPFVNEKTPSFVVSPAKQIWKDFSTGKGGNVVGFLMELESYTYPEALRFLAKRYNIEIDEEVLDEESKKAADEKESMYLVSEFAADYFHDNMLNSTSGKAIGLSYFKERGFRNETIETFKLGYSSDEWSAFSDHALIKGYKLEFLDATGLTILKENGKRFDRFKGRVIFPIHSISGRILGFGGRILKNDAKAAKYLNSPESPIYHKSNILYGIYQAKGHIIKEDNCYLVEGYTDVISMHQNGIKNVVASSGTALTDGQILLIKRFTNNITVLYDGDSAGIKASFRGIDLILAQGLNIKVLTFPDGHDPDSFSRSKSSQELKNYLNENAVDFIKFKTSILLEDAKDDPIKRAGLIRDIVSSISKIDDGIKREVYIQETSKLLDIQDITLQNELAQIDNRELQKRNQELRRERDKNKPNNSPLRIVNENENDQTNPTQQGNFQNDKYGLHRLEKDLIELLIVYGDHSIQIVENIEDGQDELGKTIYKKEIFKTTVSEEVRDRMQEDNIGFKNPFYNGIYNEIVEGLDKGENRASSYFSRHEDTSISNFVADLVTDRNNLSPNWRKRHIIVKSKEESISNYTVEITLRLKVKIIESKIDEMKDSINKTDDDIEKSEILEKLGKLTLLKNKINGELNRIL
jgi:DNA primase